MAEPKDTQEEFFMQVRKPVAFRRNLLENSKLTLTILKEVYAIKDIRSKKHEKMALLQKEIQELRTLVAKLDDSIPQYSKQELQKRFPGISFDEKKKKVEAVEVHHRVKPIVKKLSEDERLSDALATIEKKMQSLAEDEKRQKSQTLKDTISTLKKKINTL